ncbi:hypothetical protein [Bradyrhizobium guangzhouense]|uniref:hypothetical protein n=1 Tax=Bradyrhizobium guangzhouense TaxID=1325095 RepID=UPI0013E8F4B4|nr:hypothetical protein [Bradyrhizobium guangzhouense]
MATGPHVQLKPEEITIDKDGKVVINNHSLSSQLSSELQKIKNGGPVTTGFIKIDIIC